MTIHKIEPSARANKLVKPLVSRDCGPAGCEVDWLTSRRLETEWSA